MCLVWPGTFSLKKLAECLDYEVAVGALRASVGIATNERDLDRFERLLQGFRDYRHGSMKMGG